MSIRSLVKAMELSSKLLTQEMETSEKLLIHKSWLRTFSSSYMVMKTKTPKKTKRKVNQEKHRRLKKANELQQTFRIIKSKEITVTSLMIQPCKDWMKPKLSKWEIEEPLETKLSIVWFKTQAHTTWKHSFQRRNGWKRSNKSTWLPLKFVNLVLWKYVICISKRSHSKFAISDLICLVFC